MKLYLAGFHSGQSARNLLTAEHQQFIELAGESGGLSFYSVAEGRHLWVGPGGVNLSEPAGSTQILVKADGGDTYWPYSTVSPHPSLESEPDYIRNRVARYMTCPDAILRSVLERGCGTDYSLALYVSEKGERVYQEQLQEMRRVQGKVLRALGNPDIHVASTEGAVLRMWKHPDYLDGWEMKRFFVAVIKALECGDYLLAHRNPKGMPESHGAFIGGYHTVIQAEFGLVA